MMNRRQFLQTSGLAAGTILAGPAALAGPISKEGMSRIGMTTVVFRERMLTSESNYVDNELTLQGVPAYFNDRFNIRNVEYWSRHFVSREIPYLKEVKNALADSRSTLINIQVDTRYDVSDTETEKRELAIAEMKEWIDAASFLGSKMVRVSGMRKSYEEAVKSLILLNEYAKEKGIVLLVENHFDLYSDPDIYVNMAKDVADPNMGLIADFGNYPEETNQFEALEKIAPYAKLVSAKTLAFDMESYTHTSFDFPRCVRIMEDAAYKGIYSLEQWGPRYIKYDYEKIVDWMIKNVKANI